MDVKKLLKQELARIKLKEEEYKELDNKTKKIISSLEKEIKKKKIKASIFLGGSFAKKTVIKKSEDFCLPHSNECEMGKGKYDVDIFVRFDKKYKDEEISDLLGKCLHGMRVHGSRDYFKIQEGNLTFEIVPVIKISNPSKARNVTDLSYFHVSYVLKNIKKNKKLADEILLAKAFCYANNCYGAESYIKGFSGYALELMLIHYKSFLNFLKACAKNESLIVDSEHHYKNKKELLNEMNEAKQGVIIYVDPTNKNRNALAALSKETYERFRKIASSFLNKPSLSYFEAKKIDETRFNLILEAKTDRQEGDIAGSKLLKYFNYISGRIEKYFEIERKEFSYNKTAKYYFKIKQRSQIILQGPKINDVANVVKFKAKHKNVFIKNERVFAREKAEVSVKDILDSEENKKISRDMGITKIEFL